MSACFNYDLYPGPIYNSHGCLDIGELHGAVDSTGSIRAILWLACWCVLQQVDISVDCLRGPPYMEGFLWFPFKAATKQVPSNRHTHIFCSKAGEPGPEAEIGFQVAVSWQIKARIKTACCSKRKEGSFQSFSFVDYHNRLQTSAQIP